MKHRSKATGALLGLAGGVAGMMAMRYAMKGAHRVLQTNNVSSHGRTYRFTEDRRRRGESATSAAGRILYSTVMKREPSERQKRVLGQAVHWSYGLAMAAGYGMLRGNLRHKADILGGAVFGAGMWGLGDELLVPVLGLGPKPSSISAKTHAETLAAYIGYGVATATTVQGLNRLLDILDERSQRGEVHLLPSPRASDVRERLASQNAF